MTSLPPGPADHGDPATAAGPGDALVRVGGGVLIAGMLVTLVAMLPLVSAVELPSLFWWLAILLVGAGMGMVLLGLLRKGRRRARMQRAARAGTHP